MSETRREFLIKIAKGSVYSAPLIRTMAAPEGLSAQANPSQKGKGSEKKDWAMVMSNDPATNLQFGPAAPWSQNP